ncbi:class I SAM-dependent methyltransferase (plasmid) [Acuticoccus sp. MNP-M23]|uniref:class I SAM-dependent methyltransferase n=1 Tax=Acuticoccus sp. MNP-M23 TaxID=3072793 RepID=UPI0028163B0F|nr:class I SAM-dependent methyltransferase [Acuticoccus sp. MNP-M23]WMS45361.1 class I SAM-dependent methyltransferase [Acuticoccus sp. MNP-M23]
MTHWQAHPETAAQEMHEEGSPGWTAFRRQSGVVTAALHSKLLDHVPAAGMTPGTGRILEFGAGIGGVALDLAGRSGMPSDACDVNGAAMSYLAAQLPGTRCRTVPAAPPLPYADESFDALYAISIFPRLAEADGLAWLAEFARVLKPEGAALISLRGPAAVALALKSAPPGLPRVTVDDLERSGVIVAAGAALPGGGHLAAHSHAYVTGVFGKILAVEAIYPGIVGGNEDFVVLRKREP